MGFETFQRQRVPAGREPAVTIQKKGVISLNIPAFEALDSPEAVELLYDRAEQLMGLRKVDPSVEHAYTVRGLGRGRYFSNWLISGTAFVQYYGIKADRARRWIGHMQDDILVIDLKEPGKDVAGARGSEPATPDRTGSEALSPVTGEATPQSDQ